MDYGCSELEKDVSKYINPRKKMENLKTFNYCFVKEKMLKIEPQFKVEIADGREAP